MLSLKQLFAPVQNVSHEIVVVVYRLLRQRQQPNTAEVIAALHQDLDAWEKLSAEALENFEKRFD
jgi:hypothetical protein